MRRLAPSVRGKIWPHPLSLFAISILQSPVFAMVQTSAFLAKRTQSRFASLTSISSMRMTAAQMFTKVATKKMAHAASNEGVRAVLAINDSLRSFRPAG